jgi:aspartate-semialdehyde dehydrogenase
MTRRENPAGSEAMATRQGFYRVAIVGAGTLKGKELKEVLQDRNFPAVQTKLLDDDESLGQLEAVGDEATFIQGVRREQFEDVDLAFFTSDQEFTHKNWKMAHDAGCMIVDVSYALEDEPGATVRAPWVERELEAGLGLRPPTELQAQTVVTAHPAAVVLGLLLLRAQRIGALRTAATTVFEPASEHGRRGMDELHEQTVNLLSFQRLPKDVFDSQVAFNMIARYGEKSAPTLESVERRIIEHLKRTTYGKIPLPSLALVQAPIFHAHVFSLYVEFEQHTSLGDLSQAMGGEHVSITRLAEDSPSNVNAAGQDEILLSLRRDIYRQEGFWIWAAADNLRLSAIEALDCASALGRMRSKGSIQ